MVRVDTIHTETLLYIGESLRYIHQDSLGSLSYTLDSLVVQLVACPDGICAVRPDGLHAEIEPPYADELYKAV